MGDRYGAVSQADALTPARVAATAIQQAARHEHALRACLAELDGRDRPDQQVIESIRSRAVRHADRAIRLTETAIRLNPDPLADLFFRSLLERHERNALLARMSLPLAGAPFLPLAG